MLGTCTGRHTDRCHVYVAIMCW